MSSLKACLAVTLFGLIAVDQSRADEAFCKAYSAAAMQSQLEATRAECAFSTGPGRWSDNERDHYQACLGWGANTSKIAITETTARSQDLSICRARKLGVAANPPIMPAMKIAPAASLDAFCDNYAAVAIHQTEQRSALGCALTGPRWDTVFGHHKDACLSWGKDIPNISGRLSAAEMNAREADLLNCRKAKVPVATTAPAPAASPSPSAARPPGPASSPAPASAPPSATAASPTCAANPGDPVPAEWADMLAAHNDRRKSNCACPLSWSAQLARDAQAYASQCILDRHGISGGENMADAVFVRGTPGNYTPVLPAKSNKDAYEDTWYCEHNNFDFQNPAFVGGFTRNCGAGNAPKVNGHFTQVVWKDTRSVGCGKATCTMTVTINGTPVTTQGTHWVCRYSPAGNSPIDAATLKREVSDAVCK